MKKSKILIYHIIVLSIIFFQLNSVYSQFVQPSGGFNYDTWELDKNVTIKWTDSTFTDNNTPIIISIWDATSGINYIIADDINPSNTSYNWTIPADFPTGEQFRLRISQNNVVICNDNFLVIYDAPPVLLKKNIEDEIILSAPNLNIFPNPASEYIYLESNINLITDIYIYNSIGVLIEKISNINLTHSVQIDISNFKNGSYIIIYKFEGRFVSTNFIVNR